MLEQQNAPPRTPVEAALHSCRSALIGTGLISLFTNLLMLTGPLFMLQIYDRVLSSGSMPTLVAMVVLVTGLFFFLGIFEFVRSRVLVRVGLMVDEALRQPIFESVITPQTGSTQSLRDLEQLRTFISGQGPFALFDLPWVPVYFAIIFFFHVWLGFLAVAGALVLLTLSLANERLTRAPMGYSAKAAEQAYICAEAGRRNAETLQAMGMSSNFARQWLHHHSHALETQRAASDVAGNFSAATRAIRLLLQSLMLALGAYLAILQMITPGVMIAASIILSRALAPIEQSLGNWKGFAAARRSVARINDVIVSSRNLPTPMELPDPTGRIAVEGLMGPTFSDPPILKGISIELNPGDALGVIGPSACGKSTLARMLTGVWQPTRGAVRLDGAALDQWQKDQLGRSIGYLPQAVELFAGTVEENIARFGPDPDSKAVVAAAKMAGCHRLIVRLKDGYGTQIGENGAVLSAGQRQRIALARALYGDPVFVVLDEPNSNLDADGDAALTRAIERLRKAGAVTVIMAHRPSAIAACNLLLLLKRGKQSAFGPKEDIVRDHLEKPPRQRRSNITSLARASQSP